MTSLMQDLAKDFMAKHPDTPVSVTSDDSGSGISALINRTTDLATSSRDLTPEELKLIAARGERLKKITVARDAIVILVNPLNTVSEISLEQLQAVFSGQKRNWRDLGGPNQPIQVYSREKDSGTYSYFLGHVLNGKPYAATAKVLSSTEATTEAVAKNRWSIAYEGLANAFNAGSKVKRLKVKTTESGPGVLPSADSAIKDYPLSRPLIIFVDKAPKPSVREFVDFCLSDEGQKIVTSAGYAGLK